MPAIARSWVRKLGRKIHLYLGLGLAVLLVPISLSGAALVWHDEFDAFLHPSRYAVTEGVAQSPSALLRSAGAALGRDSELVSIRLANAGPAVVAARGPRSAARPQLLNVYLDPATAKVLDVVNFRDSLIGILHRFHENLTVPEYSGRSVVGWTGLALFIMSLSGIYLWWPRTSGFARGFRYRRGPATSSNLHHLFGFWISIPLAVVSATGIYLGFPQQGRQLVGAFAPMTPSQRGGFNAPLLPSPHLDADRVMTIAADGSPADKVAAIFMPNRQTGTWRVQFRGSEGTVLVNDQSAARSVILPQSGDKVAQWIRWIHEGSHSGLLWRFVVFVCGILPTVFAITGTMIWLRSRRMKLGVGGVVAMPQLGPAE